MLVINSGSSSLKVGLFGPGSGDEELLIEGEASGIGHPNGTLQLRAADGKVLLDQQNTLESQAEAL